MKVGNELEEFGRSQPGRSILCQAELSFTGSHGRVRTRRMARQGLQVRTFQQEVKDAPEELKEADQLGG